VCADLQSANLLDPCQWSSKVPAAVLVGAGQSVTAPATALIKGVLINIQLKDPSGAFTKSVGQPHGYLVVGVWTNINHFVPARVVSNGPSGRTYQVHHPFGQPVKLSLHNEKYTIEDAFGVLTNNLNQLPALVESVLGGGSPTIAFTVRGLR